MPRAEADEPDDLTEPARAAHSGMAAASASRSDAAAAPGAPDEEPEGSDIGPDAIGPLSAATQAAWADDAISRAIARGDFDDLPGKGKPLKGIGAHHDPDWWVKSVIEREQLTGLAPPAIMLRRENARLDDDLDALSSERAVREVLDDFNRRVREAMRQLMGGPPVVTHTRDIEAEVERWKERRAARRTAALEVAATAEREAAEALRAWRALPWRERRRRRREERRARSE